MFFHLSPTSSHFYPLQVENCDSNARLVVNEDDNGKLMKGVKGLSEHFDKYGLAALVILGVDCMSIFLVDYGVSAFRCFLLSDSIMELTIMFRTGRF